MLKKILPVKTFSLSISRGERRPGTKICVSTSLGEWDTIRAIMAIGEKKKRTEVAENMFACFSLPFWSPRPASKKAPKSICFQSLSDKINGLIPKPSERRCNDTERSSFVYDSREPSGVVFLVAEIIFISNSVQLLFVREGMRQDAVYFDGFVFSPPLSLLLPLCEDTWSNVHSNFRQVK